MILMNKRGFLDPEVLASPGFILLGGGSVAAVVMGYIMGSRMDSTFPMWQYGIIILGCLVASYFFAARD